jgi:hypothetical protein
MAPKPASTAGKAPASSGTASKAPAKTGTFIISLHHDHLLCYPLPLIIDRNGTQTCFHCWQGPSFIWYCLESTGKNRHIYYLLTP